MQQIKKFKTCLLLYSILDQKKHAISFQPEVNCIRHYIGPKIVIFNVWNLYASVTLNDSIYFRYSSLNMTDKNFILSFLGFFFKFFLLTRKSDKYGTKLYKNCPRL